MTRPTIQIQGDAETYQRVNEALCKSTSIFKSKHYNHRVWVTRENRTGHIAIRTQRYITDKHLIVYSVHLFSSLTYELVAHGILNMLKDENKALKKSMRKKA